MFPMLKLFHWGPLIALIIIKCVSFTTLHFFGQWCSAFSSWIALASHLFYYFLLASTFYNFLSAIFTGPGYVPSGWRPKKSSDEKYLQYCLQCEAFKAPRSHHCSKCKKCVLKMDHHCPWINNCCGYKNQKFFFLFLLSAVIGSINSLILLSISLYRALNFIPNANHKYIYLSVQGIFFILLSIGMSIGVIIAVGALLYIQAKILIRNKTSIEDWIIAKADMRERDDVFKYPYDLGKWNNIRQVLFESLGDGVVWPVINGCNQYSLTYEQLLQKKNKIQNSTMYRVISDYNGHCFPLFSQGFRVCLTFPINDDPRLVINTGDEVLVTHCHKRWLYGQKMASNTKIPLKGWFPKQCAVVLVKYQNTPDCNYDSDNNKTELHSDGGDYCKKDI